MPGHADRVPGVMIDCVVHGAAVSVVLIIAAAAVISIIVENAVIFDS